MLFIRPRVPRAGGAREDLDAPCGNDARHDGFERAGPCDRPVRPARRGGPDSDRDYRRALLSCPRAGKSVLRAHRGSDRSKAAARDRSSVGFGLSFLVCLRDDAAPARPRPDQPRRRERIRRTELDGPHGRYFDKRTERTGDGDLRDVPRVRGRDWLWDLGPDRRASRIRRPLLRLVRGAAPRLLVRPLRPGAIASDAKTDGVAAPRRVCTPSVAPAGYASIFSLYFILGAFVTLVPPHIRD